VEENSTRSVLIALVSQESGVPVEEITLDSTPLSLGMDSLDTVALAQVIDDKWCVDVGNSMDVTVGEMLKKVTPQ
jgi:acyl carrier protein